MNDNLNMHQIFTEFLPCLLSEEKDYMLAYVPGPPRSLKEIQIRLKDNSSSGLVNCWSNSWMTIWTPRTLEVLNPKTVQTMSVTFFIFSKFLYILNAEISTGQPHFIKPFLRVVGVSNFHVSATKCIADNTTRIYTFIHEASWRSPPSIMPTVFL